MASFLDDLTSKFQAKPKILECASVSCGAGSPETWGSIRRSDSSYHGSRQPAASPTAELLFFSSLLGALVDLET